VFVAWALHEGERVRGFVRKLVGVHVLSLFAHTLAARFARMPGGGVRSRF
jgi:hypothetical protein